MIKKAAGIIMIFLLFGIAITAVAYFPRFREYYNEDRKARALIERCMELEIGMTRDEVTAIMGEPFNVGEYERQGISYERLYFPSRRGASTAPQCVVDRETGLVIEVVCGDGHRIAIDDMTEKQEQAR